MELLFLNAFKGLKNHKIQMFSIIFLILLSTCIYTVMNTSLDRIEDRYYSYLEEQNVEDFSFVVNVDYEKDFTNDMIDKYLNKELSNIEQEEIQYIYLYKSCLINNDKNICNEGLYSAVNYIFNKYGIINNLSSNKIDKLSEKYNFSYQLSSSKTYSKDKNLIKLIPYIKDDKINIPYLIEGKFPTTEKEITMLPVFADKNNIKIGDNYKLGDITYKVVGFAYAPDYIYPMISFNIPIFDEDKNNIVFMYEDDYKDFNGIKEEIYVAKFNDKTDPRDRTEIILEEDPETGKITAQTSNPASKILVDEQDTIYGVASTMTRSLRIDSVQLEINTDRTFAEYFLYLLLTIAVFIIIVITKKRIEDERLQIGVLKSLGYKRGKIAFSYLVYPIVGSVVGGLLGYFIGYYLNDFLTMIFVSYFNIPITEIGINTTYLLQCILVPLVLLSVLCYIISLFMLKKKPLDLLKEGSNLKVNLLTKLVNFCTKKLPFSTRFKYSLASRSIGKLIIVSLTSFVAGLLITLVLIGANLFNGILDDTFDGLKFKYMVAYNSILDDKSDDDLILQASSKLLKTNDKEIEDDYAITLTGVDQKLNYLSIKNKDEKDLTKLLKNNQVIINENIKEVLNIDISDKLIFSINDKEVTYEVVGIDNSFLNMNIYIDREYLSEQIGFKKSSYNLKYSNNDNYDDITKLDKEEVDKIATVFSIEDLKDNVMSQMDTFNQSLYVIISFAALMVLIIIAVIANIIVEENKKTISLMKVMGYKNKKISKIVLNIYTPFVIVFYLLSVPAMVKILESIVKILTKDMEMALPISISYQQVGLGLLFLLIAYFIAINLSKKVLNKIPLSVALKRE